MLIAGITAMVADPVIAGLEASVAVIVWLPAVFMIALKVPVPFVNVLNGGRLAAWSSLVKLTVPL
jgi:hypothetical protein